MSTPEPTTEAAIARLRVKHAVLLKTAVGPGRSNSWATCTCEWEGPTRLTRSEAQADADSHATAVGGPPDPCTCHPDDGSRQCPWEAKCYAAWLFARERT